jgi:hypothetical protein
MYGYQPQPRAITRPLPPVVSTFPTTWPNTENPISQGSIWTQGGTVGLSWQNTQSTGGNPGIAWGTGSSPVSATDNISTLQNSGFSTTKHFSQITVNKPGGYTPPSSQEVELLGLFTITANNAAGYELTFGYGANAQAVRWNGALDAFDVTVCTTVSGATFIAADGDDIKVIWDSTSGSPIITIFQNSVQQWQVTDTTAGKITTGSPGMGFFARPGAGLDLSKYCNRRFNAGNA